MSLYRLLIQLSDVDRGVYESLDARLAQHPSETLRYLLTRGLAYALSYEEGITFSKGGLSSTEEPPLTVRDPTGTLLAWIDVGAPSAERLHKASKAAERVELYTTSDLKGLRRELETGRVVHRLEELVVWRIDVALLEALEARLERTMQLEVTRSDGRLYVKIGEETFEGALERITLASPNAQRPPSR